MHEQPIYYRPVGGESAIVTYKFVTDLFEQPGVCSWLDEFWPERYLGQRTPLPVNANFFFLFRGQPGDQIERAAEPSAAAADYKLRLDDEEIPPASLRDRPLFMV